MLGPQGQAITSVTAIPATTAPHPPTIATGCGGQRPQSGIGEPTQRHGPASDPGDLAGAGVWGDRLGHPVAIPGASKTVRDRRSAQSENVHFP